MPGFSGCGHYESRRGVRIKEGSITDGSNRITDNHRCGLTAAVKDIEIQTGRFQARLDKTIADQHRGGGRKFYRLPASSHVILKHTMWQRVKHGRSDFHGHGNAFNWVG